MVRGVDGSSPSEGSSKPLHRRSFHLRAGRRFGAATSTKRPPLRKSATYSVHASSRAQNATPQRPPRNSAAAEAQSKSPQTDTASAPHDANHGARHTLRRSCAAPPLWNARAHTFGSVSPALRAALSHREATFEAPQKPRVLHFSCSVCGSHDAPSGQLLAPRRVADSLAVRRGRPTPTSAPTYWRCACPAPRRRLGVTSPFSIRQRPGPSRCQRLDRRPRRLSARTAQRCRP